jgi:RND family efflux transporter MFP subunit
VTAWGEHFEIFAEADPLAVGQVATSHTHVTALHDFSALREGVVVAVLRASDGSETTFRREEALRPGIFSIEIEPKTEGTFDLLFRVDGAGQAEEILGGRVRVGSADAPGGLFTSRSQDGEADRGEPPEQGSVAGGAEAISFLKEQQWRTAFSTEWTDEGTIHFVARGPGRIRPVAGGEIVLTAPLGGVVVGDPSPYVGLDVERETVVFELTPRVAAGRSLAELEATHTEKESALNLAEDRLARLEALLPLEAVSSAEVENARGQVTTLRAQHAAAARDLATARALAPINGQIAEVLVTPGEVVEAGETLARLVQVEPLWVEVFLQPDKAGMLNGEPDGLSVRGANDASPVSFGPDRVRLVARSPEVSRRTGTVTCIFEVSGAIENLRLGSAVEAEVFLPETQHGIVIPTSAVVDDGGIPVVYVQLDGEGFVRQEIGVRTREGSSLLVDGLALGQRLVTVGGAAIRRSTLVSSGVGEGHVH